MIYKITNENLFAIVDRTIELAKTDSLSWLSLHKLEMNQDNYSRLEQFTRINLALAMFNFHVERLEICLTVEQTNRAINKIYDSFK